MIENQLQSSNPDSESSEQETVSQPQPVSIEQLAKTVLENTLFQKQFNHSVKTSIQDLTHGILETHQVLQRLTRNLTQQVERLRVNNPSCGRLAVPVGEGLLLTKVLNNFLMYVEASDMGVAPHLLMEGHWEQAITQAFVARLRPGMTVVDVGANYGYFSLVAARGVGNQGRVYSFEPNPSTFEILKRNIEVNWLGHIIEAHPHAALDSRKQVQLHALRKFQASSSLFPPELVPEPDPPAEEWRWVQAVPLDEMIPDKVDLIKIDAEGSEPLVIEGMKGILDRSPHLTIFMEMNIPMLRKTTDPASFLKKIRELGGTLHYFTPWNTLEPFDEEKAMQSQLFDLLIERKGNSENRF